jgi:post-segregation antitoxin (ccd killing protein)
MTTLKLNLPDDLAQRAQSAGLLTDAAIQKLLEDAIRRDAGRRLLAVGKRLQAANIAPMSDEEIVAEVKAVRAARRARNSPN